MIGIIVRGLTFLKVLAPIMLELKALGKDYIIFYHDASHGAKEYDRPTLVRLQEAHAASAKQAKKLVPFSNDGKLVSLLVANKVKKIVSLEVWICSRKHIKGFKKHNIKICSVSYLTDSIWQPEQSVTSVDRVYYSSEYLMRIHHDFAKIKFLPTRDRCLGSPLFDSLYTEQDKKTNDVLVLLPNLKSEHVKSAFGKQDNFFKIIEKIHSSGRPLIFKTRKKQWMPSEISKYSKKIVYDGKTMYPSAMSDLLKTCSTTILFYSSGIFESVYGQNHTINIPLPLKRWSWDITKLKQYFSKEQDSLYNFSGCVENAEQSDILSGKFILPSTPIDQSRRDLWIQKFIGSCHNGSAKRIATDIASL